MFWCWTPKNPPWTCHVCFGVEPPRTLPGLVMYVLVLNPQEPSLDLSCMFWCWTPKNPPWTCHVCFGVERTPKNPPWISHVYFGVEPPRTLPGLVMYVLVLNPQEPSLDLVMYVWCWTPLDLSCMFWCWTPKNPPWTCHVCFGVEPPRTLPGLVMYVLVLNPQEPSLDLSCMFWCWTPKNPPWTCHVCFGVEPPRTLPGLSHVCFLVLNPPSLDLSRTLPGLVMYVLVLNPQEPSLD